MRQSDCKNLVPPITESRLERQFAAIRARLPETPARRRWLPVPGGAVGWSVAAACAAALVFTLVKVHGSEGLADGTVIESAPEGQPGASIALADGSRVDLGPAARARLTSAQRKAIRIDLERGSIEVEATHLEGRTFEVVAGAYEVHVVGTHFAVTRDAASEGGRVTVRVDRGAVDVVATGRSETRRLAAGEQWSAGEGETTHASALPPPEPAPAPAEPAPAAAPAPRPVFNAPAAPRHDETARELFDEAQRARADGRPDDAARAFDRLRKTFPRDPRAALSAFELGRLRLDALGDPRGAEEALRDAIALGPSSPFREDAEARHVEALGRMGDATGCIAARAAYLARWPNGTYRRAVEVGCGDR